VTQIIIIAGIAQNKVIGNKGQLPWHISEDLKHFKDLTLGHPVIMGRVTHEEILSKLGKPLPGRTNIVISRSNIPSEGILVVHSVRDAIEEAKKYGDKIYIIGGRNIYEQTIDLADKLEITEVYKNFDGDVLFPNVHEEDWREIAREDKNAQGMKFSFVTYEKVR
jgi:dihydrofolate reductase